MASLFIHGWALTACRKLKSGGSWNWSGGREYFSRLPFLSAFCSPFVSNSSFGLIHTGSDGIDSVLKFCVVGAGPAGFYTAEKILKQIKDSKVDVLDRLPTPFGLVRSGVAPDHPETKLVINQFTRVASDERFRFFGNVHVGTRVLLQDLLDRYHAVVLAYGAESDRLLGISGENLPGVMSAREFVWWYNGHPDFANIEVDLTSSDTAVILGQGNVALDCARILLRDREELKRTDISLAAFTSLENSMIKKVLIVGRRGPVQAACTAKEVRELLALKNVSVSVDKDDLNVGPLDEVEMKNNRSRRRVYDLFCKASNECSTSNAEKQIKFIFFHSPSSFLPVSEEDERVGFLELEKTTLKVADDGKSQQAVKTGHKEIFPCGLVLRSIGYKSLPIPGVPFDDKRGIVPNLHGRVLAPENETNGNTNSYFNGVYVVGWLKRGPTGIIGTNSVDADETVACIMEDWKKGRLKQEWKSNLHCDLELLLKQRAIEYISFDEWKKINEAEELRGQEVGKSRVKLLDVREMFSIAKNW